jgi:hypothetical protein
MKTTQTLLAALAIALVFGACSKEQPAVTELEKVSTTPQFEMSDDDHEAINLIIDFKENLDRHKNGDLLKSDVYVSMEDAKWLIESVINVFHGFPDAEIAYFTFEEEKVALPKENLNDLMNVEEVALFDEDIRNRIIQQLASYGLDGRHLVQSELSFTENADSLLIKTLIGVEGDERLPYKDYWYGNLMGACDGTFQLETDAAKRIESLVHYQFILNRPTPPANCRYVYINPVSKEIKEPWLPEYQINFPPVNYLDFKVFFASDYFNEVPQGDLDDDIKCLDYNSEMLFYKQNYIELIEEFEIEKNKVYTGCEFEGKWFWYWVENIDYYSIMHNLNFTVSSRILICEIDDPIPIHN